MALSVALRLSWRGAEAVIAHVSVGTNLDRVFTAGGQRPVAVGEIQVPKGVVAGVANLGRPDGKLGARSAALALNMYGGSGTCGEVVELLLARSRNVPSPADRKARTSCEGQVHREMMVGRNRVHPEAVARRNVGLIGGGDDAVAAGRR